MNAKIATQASQLFPIVKEMEAEIRHSDTLEEFYLCFVEVCTDISDFTKTALLTKNAEGAFILTAKGKSLSSVEGDDFVDFSSNFVVQRFDEAKKMTVVSLDDKVVHLIPVFENTTSTGLLWLESQNRMPASIEMIVFHLLNIYKNKERHVAEIPMPENKGKIKMLLERLSQFFKRR